jgi:hypothetical protein
VADPRDSEQQSPPRHEVDPRLAEKRELRGEGNISQITAEMDAGTVDHVYQTADGREMHEEIAAADASMVPNEGNTPVVTSERESLYGVPEGVPTEAAREV